MLWQAAEQKLPHHLLFFYSNRRPEDVAFPEELEELEKENTYYKFIGTMTEMARSIIMVNQDDQVETGLRKTGQS